MAAGPAGRVEIGRVTKPHGLQGEVVIAGARLTAEEIQALGELHARDRAGGLQRLVLVSVRPFVHQMLARFAGVTDRDRAAELAGCVLEAETSRLPRLEAGTVYLFQLLGLTVETEAGEVLGRVREVLQTGATPVLVVAAPPPEAGGKARERLIPMSPEMLVRVDLAAQRILVRLLPGMEEL